MTKLDWPLMQENITGLDIYRLTAFLNKNPMPRLTQGDQVKAFEEEWSQWLGMKYSVYVNSGASANLITLALMRERTEGDRKEVIVSPLGWVSDITSIIYAGFTPIFVDIDPKTLGASLEDIKKKVTDKTCAILLTHILGYGAITNDLLDFVKEKQLYLIEDVCESYGATFDGNKLGTFGFASNFSFYYAHHMSTIEGGMISTNDFTSYDVLKMLRSHGMVRDASEKLNSSLIRENSDLSKHFIFPLLGYNVRGTEIGALIGRSQLKSLDERNEIRKENAKIFYENLDGLRYRIDLPHKGSCSYAFVLILKEQNTFLRNIIERIFERDGVEYRRGLSGGGNQLLQPYLNPYRKQFSILSEREIEKRFPNVTHVHYFGWYIGNYPGLERWKIEKLCEILNRKELT